MDVGAINVYTDPLRSSWQRVMGVLEANNPGSLNDFIVQPAALRVENVITTKTNYTFNLYETQGGQQQTPTEIKLNRNDAFFVTHISLLLAKQVTGVSAVPLANTRVWSYPDAVTFSGAGEAAALEAFYNALMTFKTVPIERIQALDTNVFRVEPPTRVAATSGDEWGPGMGMFGYFRLPAEIILDGSQDNSISVNLANGADIDAAAGITDESNILITKCFGYKVINGAQKVGLYLR